MTASYNGTAFTPTVLTSAYLGGQTVVTANDGTRNLLINGNSITAIGAYSAAQGNPNSLLVQWLDGVTYSTGYGGTGTVTFSVLQLGRVAGSFNVVAKTVNGSASMSLVGLFDIKYP